MALTKSVVTIQDWEDVAMGQVSESIIYDNSANYDCVLSIQAFLNSTTAHIGSEFIIQTSAFTSGNTSWEDCARYLNLVSTAPLAITITNSPAAAGTTVFTSGTVASGWEVADLESRWVAIQGADYNLNPSLPEDSELMLQTGYKLNTNITVKDGCKNAHSVRSKIYSVASSKIFSLPRLASRIRVIVNNNYDSNGSGVLYKVMASVVSGL